MDVVEITGAKPPASCRQYQASLEWNPSSPQQPWQGPCGPSSDASQEAKLEEHGEGTGRESRSGTPRQGYSMLAEILPCVLDKACRSSSLNRCLSSVVQRPGTSLDGGHPESRRVGYLSV